MATDSTTDTSLHGSPMTDVSLPPLASKSNVLPPTGAPPSAAPLEGAAAADFDILFYPESDEVKMGETDHHRYWRSRLYDLLFWRYRGQNVYVASDLFVYYKQWKPKASFAPDLFVVLDCDPRFRRTFKTWEERRTPNFAIEVASEGTYNEDQLIKPRMFEIAGIREYFLYDPHGQYFDPPLQGYRYKEGEIGYELIPQDDRGAFASEELGLLLWLDGDELIVADRQSGLPLLTQGEEAEQLAAQNEEENRRLREEIERLRGQ